VKCDTLAAPPTTAVSRTPTATAERTGPRLRIVLLVFLEPDILDESSVADELAGDDEDAARYGLGTALPDGVTVGASAQAL
jgi:hypothetical protein